MKPEDTIIWMLDDIADKMCKEYCKWPEKYETSKNEDDKNFQTMQLLNEKCANCPIVKIGFIPDYSEKN